MRISLEVDAETHELERLVRMLLLGQISDADVNKAAQREAAYKRAENSARVSQLFIDACDRNDRRKLTKEIGA
jgi:hypothetical protein